MIQILFQNELTENLDNQFSQGAKAQSIFLEVKNIFFTGKYAKQLLMIIQNIIHFISECVQRFPMI